MKVICVDDEKPALENFRFTVQKFPEVDELHLFQNGKDALEWAKNHVVDVAFLDIEMEPVSGLEMAEKLTKIDENISIVFITAYDKYAFQAFGVNAIGYLLKPYDRQDVLRELNKVSRIRPVSRKRVSIQTIPDFAVTVDGERLSLSRAKTEELLALMVDRGKAGVSTGEIISCLWPERLDDEKSKSLCRMTFKRLLDFLREKGIDDIIAAEGRRKFLLEEKVECDLYRFLAGDERVVRIYNGEYLREYSWAEERVAQLNNIKKSFKV
ncbi:MAG: response regulator [Clostridia bacterium]|nr:response regulator [Clostridia bacterium]MDY5554467.1 response regulator [Blautia sp.]